MNFKQIVQKFTGKTSIQDESPFMQHSVEHVILNEENRKALKRFPSLQQANPKSKAWKH